MAFPFATLLDNDLGLQDLPEEVREAIEIHKDEIHSEEDLREMAKGAYAETITSSFPAKQAAAKLDGRNIIL